MGGACSPHETEEKTYLVFVGKPEGQKLLRRPRCGRKNNFKMDLIKKLESVHWINVSRDRDQLMGSCEYHNEHPGSVKEYEFLDWLNDHEGLYSMKYFAHTTVPR